MSKPEEALFSDLMQKDGNRRNGRGMLTSFPAMALRKLPEEDLRGMDIALAGAAKHRAISPSFYATLDACRLTVDRTDSTKT